ncbi:MAG: glycosyltransferase family 2 protein [PVC group bacterium]
MERRSPPEAAALIPAYNEAGRIADVVKGARQFVSRVLVVDDGSADETAARAAGAGAEVIRQPVNRGKGAVLRTGFEALTAGGADPIIVLDGDGQHDPAEIPAFLDAARRTGAEIVVGNRMQAASAMPPVRYWTNRVMSKILSRLIGQEVPDSQCGYRLITRRVLERLSLTTGNYDTESEMLIQASRLGFTIRSIPVKTIYTGQTSKIHPGRDTLRFIKLVLRNLPPLKPMI